MRPTFLMLLVLILAATGCSLLPEKIDETRNWSANQLYTAAREQLKDHNYEKAIDYFEKLEARYPFGRYAQQAQLEIAYAYYKYDEPDQAIATLDRFIKIYPRHPNVDYAWYLKGLTNFNRGKTVVDKLLPQDPSEHDTVTMRQAYDDFHQLTEVYPNSIYAKDAAQRMIYLRNNLAGYEMHVADYYMRRKAYVAAANRAKYVIENYERTTSVPDALVVLVRAYRKLGETDLAGDALKVLHLNFPHDPDLALLESPGGYPADQPPPFWKFW